MTVTRRHIMATVAMVGVLGSAGAARQSPKLVAPVRGPAKVEITKPSTKLVGNEVVTTILLKNVESAPIAGLRVEENWYDRSGTPIGGDIYRHRRPLQPNEVITIELRSRRPAPGSRNQYAFTHGNGPIRQTTVAKLEPPKKTTDD